MGKKKDQLVAKIQKDPFLAHYFETALWSSTDPDTEDPLDRDFYFEDFDFETLKEMVEEANDFRWNDEVERALDILDDQGFDWDEGLLGHDFWLTRNRHGAGFWDGDWPEPADSILTEASHAYGEVYIYPGDDGKLYSG